MKRGEHFGTGSLRTAYRAAPLFFIRANPCHPWLKFLLLLVFPLSVSADTVAPFRPITADDRVLVVAPHPDDESLGAGGLLQRAVAARAAIRVVFLTNGDNNVWAQRFVEHRVAVGPADKARWGARRQKEALCALDHLGVPAKDALFLGFHDCGTTALLMKNDPAYRAAIDSSILAWRPTLLVLPSPDDLHPDHNAAWVITHLEYRRLDAPPPPLELDYLVHTNGRPYVPRRVELALTPREKEAQLEAIQCHATQMALGRKRFSAYARDVETFEPRPHPEEFAPRHPVCEAKLEHGVLHLAICLRNSGGLNGAAMDVAMQTTGGDAIRLGFPIPATSQNLEVTDTITGRPVAIAVIHVGLDDITIDLPVDPRVRMAFVKLDHAPIFFDTAGWRQIPVNAAPR